MPGSEGPAGLPRWDLGPAYPSLGSAEFAAAKARLASLAAELLELLASVPAPAGGFGDWLAEALLLEGEAGSLYETLWAYAYAVFSTDTGDAAATAQINALEELGLPLKRAEVLFRNALASRRAEAEALVGEGGDPRVADLAFHVREELFWQSRQMAPELEDLAADLLRSGGDAWGRLQETATSSASAPWQSVAGDGAASDGAAGGGAGRKTLVELRNLAYDPDRSVRERAYRAELGLCESIALPVAAAFNGVKGFSASLDARRGWESSLDKAARQARVSRGTLDALLAAMEESLPSWRRYLGAKARLLGLGKCAFYDLFAPVGCEGRRFSFDEARDFIVAEFSAFDPEMGGFASRAFAERWIDAEPRPGKVGGAYCIYFPEIGDSRILCNYDGTFGAMSTVAHELGHAWHGEALRGQSYANTKYPMTLAETASIFAETIVFEGALEGASGPEGLALLELRLQDACQVIVDILSRFRFEREAFARRAKAELSPAELCGLMLDAQKATYGDALDPDRLHPYMWLVKGHYYSTGLPFYNFPYAFGQLFAAGLYARYEAEGPSFAADYRRILARTGGAGAVEVAAGAGFDIEGPEFWRSGLATFARQVEELERRSTCPSA